jgi:uncharacterized LabA/DUF88 family protein
MPKIVSFISDLIVSSRSNKIALFIDGANLYATCRTVGFDIDYKRLLNEFASRGTLVRALYYTTIIEDQEYSSLRPLIDWLDYNGYSVVTKAAKEFIDANGQVKIRGNMHIEIAVDAMELAEHVDQIVLFSGDGDFRSLVEAVQRRGVHVTVVSSMNCDDKPTYSPMCPSFGARSVARWRHVRCRASTAPHPAQPLWRNLSRDPDAWFGLYLISPPPRFAVAHSRSA